MTEKSVNIIEDKAIPEWFIVKREILWSMYQAINEIRRVHKSKILGGRNRAAEANFESWTIDLYQKIRAEVKKKNKKEYNVLLGLDEIINNGSTIGYEQSLKCFRIIQKFVFRVMGITDIKVKSSDPSSVFRR